VFLGWFMYKTTLKCLDLRIFLKKAAFNTNIGAESGISFSS